jgi:hypothetical protein
MIAPEAAAAAEPGDGSLRTRLARAGLDWIVPAWNAPGVRAFVTTRNGDPACAQAFLPAAPALL